MLKNLNITRGLIFSQTVLLRLVEKGISREEAYKIVQDSSMNVWQDTNRNLRSELAKSESVKKFLTEEDLDDIFDPKKMLKNVDYIFERSVEK
jgi:adenylosuccinate lyase